MIKKIKIKNNCSTRSRTLFRMKHRCAKDYKEQNNTLKSHKKSTTRHKPLGNISKPWGTLKSIGNGLSEWWKCVLSHLKEISVSQEISRQNFFLLMVLIYCKIWYTHVIKEHYFLMEKLFLWGFFPHNSLNPYCRHFTLRWHAKSKCSCYEVSR